MYLDDKGLHFPSLTLSSRIDSSAFLVDLLYTSAGARGLLSLSLYTLSSARSVRWCMVLSSGI